MELYFLFIEHENPTCIYFHNGLLAVLMFSCNSSANLSLSYFTDIICVNLKVNLRRQNRETRNGTERKPLSHSHIQCKWSNLADLEPWWCKRFSSNAGNQGEIFSVVMQCFLKHVHWNEGNNPMINGSYFSTYSHICCHRRAAAISRPASLSVFKEAAARLRSAGSPDHLCLSLARDLIEFQEKSHAS